MSGSFFLLRRMEPRTPAVFAEASLGNLSHDSQSYSPSLAPGAGKDEEEEEEARVGFSSV